MLYLYAFTDSPTAALPTQTGLGGQPICQHQHGGLAAIYSPLPHPLNQPSRTEIWHHQAILEALMQHRTVLPFRFGTVLGHPKAVENLLNTHHTAINRNLNTLQGRIEVAVRSLGHLSTPSKVSPPALSKPSGTAYLQQRLAQEKTRSSQEAQANRHFQQVNAHLSPLSVAHTHHLLPHPHTLFKAAYLLEAATLPHFQHTLAEVNRTQAGLRLVCTGPWPAYSFVDLPRLSV